MVRVLAEKTFTSPFEENIEEGNKTKNWTLLLEGGTRYVVLS